MKKIHLMGILGSGMSGIASLAAKMDYEVNGCDLKMEGHNPNHLENIDLLVVSPAILYQESENSELLLGKKRNIVTTWEEFLGNKLAKDKKVIAIAGTHGKSTTTGMVGKLLEDNDFDPLVVIGANVKSWGGNSRFGRGKYFVIEADEFNDNFLHYHPEIIIINNIEFDHPDYFISEKQLYDSFQKFVGNLVGEKILIANWDNEGVRNLLNNIDLNKLKLIKYSRELKAINYNLKVLGDHNITNALGVVKLGEVLGIAEDKIVNSLENFEGIGRRMEEISPNIYDDYAHHPTAIRITLQGVRQHFPNKKIWAIIEPHGYARTKALLSFYKGAFDSVDKVLVGPIFKARDRETFEMTPEKIKDISNHKNIKAVDSLDEILKIVKAESNQDDIFVIMGAGDSNLWAKQILQVLQFSKKIEFKNLTTLKVGGNIKYFREVSSKKDVVEAVDFANKNNISIFVIGGGSDIAPSDKDFDGLVVKYVGSECKFEEDIVTAESGMVWDYLVKLTVERNLQGIECLSGIPGSVGASPIQNIGAYGQELSETFIKLTAYDIANQKFVIFKNNDCKFGYRDSVFKQKDCWQKFIIVDITVKLNKYEDKDLELQTVRDEILRVRSEKLENPNDVPNAGSFFKNPIVDLKTKQRLEKKYPEIKIYPAQGGSTLGGKIPAGWLIEKADWKGKSLGPVKVSDKHALVLTNPEGKGNFSDIKKLADTIIKDVYKMFKIKLEPEVQYINI